MLLLLLVFISLLGLLFISFISENNIIRINGLKLTLLLVLDAIIHSIFIFKDKIIQFIIVFFIYDFVLSPVESESFIFIMNIFWDYLIPMLAIIYYYLISLIATVYYIFYYCIYPIYLLLNSLILILITILGFILHNLENIVITALIIICLLSYIIHKSNEFELRISLNSYYMPTILPVPIFCILYYLFAFFFTTLNFITNIYFICYKKVTSEVSIALKELDLNSTKVNGSGNGSGNKSGNGSGRGSIFSILLFEFAILSIICVIYLHFFTAIWAEDLNLEFVISFVLCGLCMGFLHKIISDIDYKNLNFTLIFLYCYLPLIFLLWYTFGVHYTGIDIYIHSYIMTFIFNFLTYLKLFYIRKGSKTVIILILYICIITLCVILISCFFFTLYLIHWNIMELSNCDLDLSHIYMCESNPTDSPINYMNNLNPAGSSTTLSAKDQLNIFHIKEQGPSIRYYLDRYIPPIGTNRHNGDFTLILMEDLKNQFGATYNNVYVMKQSLQEIPVEQRKLFVRVVLKEIDLEMGDRLRHYGPSLGRDLSPFDDLFVRGHLNRNPNNTNGRSLTNIHTLFSNPENINGPHLPPIHPVLRPLREAYSPNR